MSEIFRNFAKICKIGMNKTFNIYCDESCHMEHDHKKYMFLGNVNCAYPQVKRYAERIKELKLKHHFYAEIKWTNVSVSMLPFYLELVDCFFDTELRFRAVGINKEKIKCDEADSTYEDFYYKMYYQLLNHQVDTTDHYNVYIDIKDTWSNHKAKRLEEILNTKYGVFKKVQCIRSDESVLLQLADFLMGAIAYNINDQDKRNPAKVRVVEQIKKHYPELDLTHTNFSEKFNLFFIQLR